MEVLINRWSDMYLIFGVTFWFYPGVSLVAYHVVENLTMT